jgi:hypothetical protein
MGPKSVTTQAPPSQRTSVKPVRELDGEPGRGRLIANPQLKSVVEIIASVLNPPASSVERNLSRTPCAPPQGCTASAVVVVNMGAEVVVLAALRTLPGEAVPRVSELFPPANSRTAPPTRRSSKSTPKTARRRRFDANRTLTIGRARRRCHTHCEAIVGRSRV